MSKTAAKNRPRATDDAAISVAEPHCFRHVPYNIEVEQALLGAILVDNRQLERVTPVLNAEHFYDPLHSRLYATMADTQDRGGMVLTPLTLHAAMKADQGLQELGGHSYLVGLVQAAPALPNVRDYARIVHDLATRRSLICIGEDMVNAAYDAPLDNPPLAQIKDADAALRLVREKCADPDERAKVLTSAEFVEGHRAPDYVLGGVLQRGFLYSLTAPTGAGKTAVSLRLMAHAASGKALGDRDMAQGRVLMLVGENADDVRARWIALGEHLGFFPNEIAVDFVPAIFSISDALPQLRAQAERVGGYSLVSVDTSAAYFEGDDENSNKELGDHARVLRSLTRLKGNPCVIANCHPTKNAAENNLLPRGGGSFIAEVDGNLTVLKKEGSLELHWQGKFRGPDFEPMAFELLTVTSDALRDSTGQHVPTVIARPLSDTEQKVRADAIDIDLQRLLSVMLANPGLSIARLADKAAWHMADGATPYKSKAARLLGELKKQGLAGKVLNAWALTTAGEKAAKRMQK